MSSAEFRGGNPYKHLEGKATQKIQATGWDDPLPDLERLLAAKEAQKGKWSTQEKELPKVLGNFSDGIHTHDDIQVRDGKIFYNNNQYDVNTLTTQLEAKRQSFVGTSERVARRAYEVAPGLQKVFAPFNGGETIGLSAEHTVAVDRLPIGTPAQVDALYKNEFARGIYLVDKLERGHSYSGVNIKLGYTGAMLRWDIEEIQKGEIKDITYLDNEGKRIIDRNTSASGIKITYTDANNKARVHEQYSCDINHLPQSVKKQMGSFDALYLRGTENLVHNKSFSLLYKSCVEGVKPGGILVSDSKIE